MFKIRPTKKDDLEAIISIEKLSFNSPYTDDMVKYIVYNKNAINLVAEKEGEIIGYIFAVLRTKREGHVISIAIRPDFRKKGVGLNLIKEIIKILKVNKANKLILEVNIANQGAINFYEKLGFNMTKTIEKYYDNREDAYEMELIF